VLMSERERSARLADDLAAAAAGGAAYEKLKAVHNAAKVQFQKLQEVSKERKARNKDLETVVSSLFFSGRFRPSSPLFYPKIGHK
jgi:hypothetical protein